MSERAATSPDVATLLVCCPDRRGLVAGLAQMLYGHGANILDSQQHIDSVASQFFQRIRFDLAELHTDRVALEAGIREVAQRFQMDWRLSYSSRQKRMAIFVSRYDHCLYDLLLRHRAGDLPCSIPLVISNHPDLKSVAEQFGIEFQNLSRDDELVLDTDFYANVRVEGKPLRSGFQIEDVNTGKVEEVMTPVVHSVTETTSVEAVARMMIREHIHRNRQALQEQMADDADGILWLRPRR